MHHHGVTFYFGSSKVCSLAILETCFFYDRDKQIAATDYYIYFYISVLFPSTVVYTSINKFYSFRIFSLLFYYTTIAYHVGLNAVLG